MVVRRLQKVEKLVLQEVVYHNVNLKNKAEPAAPQPAFSPIFPGAFFIAERGNS